MDPILTLLRWSGPHDRGSRISPTHCAFRTNILELGAPRTGEFTGVPLGPILRRDEDQSDAFSAFSKIATSGPNSGLPSYRRPLMKKVGVPFTPLRMPLM